MEPNAEQKSCIVCQKPLSWVPPGTSKKTGRPYNGFWACPDNHRQNAPSQPSYQRNPISASAFDASLTDNKQAMIVMQHSQDMAIKALELLYKLHPEELIEQVKVYGLIKTIKDYTDVFHKEAMEAQ